jgi:hypothetical protein
MNGPSKLGDLTSKPCKIIRRNEMIGQYRSSGS